MVWVRRAIILGGWAAFILIFGDAVDPDFDIDEPVLDGLAVLVVIAVLAAITALSPRN